LGDGTGGIVNRIGLVETELKGPDGVTEKIPNSLLYKQRVKNLSRVQVCQVRQVLRFPIQDIPRMPSIIEDIKIEIRAACPKLIVDGSKPFTVTLFNFKEDYLEVVVNTFHDIKPGSTFYLDNRQNMLFAIAKAVEKNGSAMGKITL
jgi:small-conductance mechanosensitive channel